VKILILGNAHREGVTEEVERSLPFLREQAEVLAVDLHQETPLEARDEADIALVFGGDGAILRAVRQMGYHQVPILGVNLGRLGFLADIHPQELEATFRQVSLGHYRVTRHLMYECTVQANNGGRIEAMQTFLGLNEVVIYTVPPMHMLDLHIQIDGVEAARFHGDGIIISTPIGSTAHNLSAGGPILNQELPAFVLTPVCPHALTYRSVVDSADRVYTIRVGKNSTQAVVIVDGQDTRMLQSGEQVLIRRASVDFGLVRVPHRGFYQTLREKLHWGTPPNYRGEPG